MVIRWCMAIKFAPKAPEPASSARKPKEPDKVPAASPAEASTPSKRGAKAKKAAAAAPDKDGDLF